MAKLAEMKSSSEIQEFAINQKRDLDGLTMAAKTQRKTTDILKDLNKTWPESSNGRI